MSLLLESGLTRKCRGDIDLAVTRCWHIGLIARTSYGCEGERDERADSFLMWHFHCYVIIEQRGIIVGVVVS